MSKTCSEDCCAIGLKCVTSAKKSVCRSNNYREKCQVREECFGNSRYGPAMCVEGLCQPLRLAGDRCNSRQDCFGEMACDENTKVCQGLSNGEVCQDDEECAFNAFCLKEATSRTGICQASYSIGEQCQSQAQCENWNLCQNGTCVAPYSQVVGASCSVPAETMSFTSACESGLICAANRSQCQDSRYHDAENTFGRKCRHEADCQEPSNCDCNRYVGQKQCTADYVPKSQVVEAQLALNECLISHQCKTSYRWEDDGSCEWTHCAKAFQKATKQVCQQLGLVLGKCLHVPRYQSCSHLNEDVDDDDYVQMSQPMIFATVMGVMILIALLSVLAFYAYKRGYLTSLRQPNDHYLIVPVNE